MPRSNYGQFVFWMLLRGDVNKKVGNHNKGVQKVVGSHKKYDKAHYNILLSCSMSICPYSILNLSNSIQTIMIKFSNGT